MKNTHADIHTFRGGHIRLYREIHALHGESSWQSGNLKSCSSGNFY